MKRQALQNHLQVSLTTLLLLFVFLCTACTPGVPTSTQPQATPQPAQSSLQLTGSQVLANGSVTYVALGASDAVGVGSDEPDAEGYVPLLAERLPAGSRLINLGSEGILLDEALEKKVPLAVSESPELITIWLVVNDFIAGVTYDNYMQDLDTLLQQLRSGAQARIVIANLPDLTRLPILAEASSEQKARVLTQIKRWNEGIQKQAARYNVSIVDLFASRNDLTTHP